MVDTKGVGSHASQAGMTLTGEDCDICKGLPLNFARRSSNGGNQECCSARPKKSVLMSLIAPPAISLLSETISLTSGNARLRTA